MRRTSRRTAAVAVLLAFAAAAAADPVSSDLVIAAKGGFVIQAKIEPAGDVDSFAVFLAAKDVLTVSSREISPAYGLFSNLGLLDPAGADAHPVVRGQGKQKASFVYTAA